MATPSLAGGGLRTPGHRGGGLRTPPIIQKERVKSDLHLSHINVLM